MLIGHSIGSADGIILSFDGAVGDVLQRTCADLVGRSYLEVTYLPDRAANISRLAGLRIGDEPVQIRKRYIRPDGTTIWIDTIVSRLASGADAGRMVGTLQWADEGRQLETPANLWRKARIMDATLMRRMRALGRDLFVDYPWFILLQLYLAEAEGRMVSAHDIADIGELPRSTIGRWLIALAGKGLVERGHGHDQAAQLTKGGLDHVEDLLVTGCG